MVLGDWGPNGRADIKTSLTFCLWDMSALTLPSWVEDVYCKKTLDIDPNKAIDLHINSMHGISNPNYHNIREYLRISGAHCWVFVKNDTPYQFMN